MKTLYKNNFINALITTSICLLFLSGFGSDASAQTVIPGAGGSANIVVPGATRIYLPPTASTQSNNLDAFGGAGASVSDIRAGRSSADGTVLPLDAFGGTGPNISNTSSGNASAGGDTAAEQPSTEIVSPLSGANKWIYGFFITIGGIFTWFGGMMLDTSLNYFVLGMGQLYQSGNFGFTVDYLWTVIRDLFNILFIFVLIWIGIKTILSSDDSTVKRQLGALIAAALLINFSLLITKTIVDFTNIAASQIYKAIQIEDPTNGSSNSGSFIEGSAGVDKSISAAFMQQFNLATYANSDGIRINQKDGDSFINWRVIGFGFIMMIVFIIAGFAFLSGAILLLYRFIALLIFMMLSPAMFLGWIYPNFNKYSNMWWQHFISNAFVAPAYLFMLYMSLRIINGMPAAAGSNGGMYFGTAFDNGGADFAVFTYFFVMAGFLIASTRVAGLMGAAGASMTAKIGNVGKNFALGTAGTLSGFNYAKRLGQNAASGASGAGYRNLPFIGGNASRSSAQALAASRERSRAGNATVGDKVRIGYQRARGAGSLDQREATLNASANQQVLGGRSANQVAAAETQSAQAVARRNAAEQNLGLVGNNYSKLRKANKQQLQQIYESNPQSLLSGQNAAQITEAQVGSIQELTNEGVIGVTERDNILTARTNALATLSTGTNVGSLAAATFFGNMSSADIAQLDDALLKNMAQNDLLQVGDLEAIMKGGRRNVSRADIKNSINNRAAIAGSPQTVVAARNWLAGGTSRLRNGPGINF